jgi:hypothetical protein
MKRLPLLLVLLLVLLAACGGESPQPATTSSVPPAAPPPPTAEQARALIAGSPEFGDFEFTNASYALPLQRTNMNEPQRAAAQDLAKAGWLELGDTITLTSKSEHDKRFLLRPNGTLDIVPLAKKELEAVTNVAAGAEGPVATFSWKWLPNDVGSAFHSGPVAERLTGPQTAKATLLWDASANAWTVLRIER